MSHTTPNAPIPDTPLVWTTVTNGIARQFVDEWARLRRRPSTLRHVNTWDFLPHTITQLDQLLTLSGFGSELDDTAGHLDWLENGVWCGPPRAADADANVEQLGVDLLGRVFVGDRPAWGARGGTEFGLLCK